MREEGITSANRCHGTCSNVLDQEGNKGING